MLPALVTMLLVGCVSSQQEQTGNQITTSPINADTPLRVETPLRELGDRANLAIGAAFETRHLNDPLFRETLIREFSQITPENEMKWSYIEPKKGEFDFSKSDQLVDFAIEHGMVVRGHTLVWHIQNPDWLEKGNWSKDELSDILENHIRNVVGHYKGKVAYWDVVNEALDDNGGFRDTIWYRTFGEDYIEMAFRWAHEADPDALLFYNDYSTEGMNAKSNAVYRLVKKLVDKGVPIHGVGTQLHLTVDSPISDASIARNIERLTEMQLSFHFTEVDVRVRDGDEYALDEQAKRYETLAKLAAYYPDVDMFTMWGLTDKYSWVPSWFKGYGRALIFDENYQEKPAYWALKDVLVDVAANQFSYEPMTDLSKIQRFIQPFNAKQLASNTFDPKQVVFYPFAYNQLDVKNQTLPPRSSIDGKWGVGFYMNSLIGQVIRHDNKTVTDQKMAHENDNVEIFIRIGEQFWQLRSIVGQGFAPSNFPGKIMGKWSDDGKVFDYSIEFTDFKDLVGETIGFNIALSDNDGDTESGGRNAQLYPLTGNNIGWQGEEFGELFMNGQNAVIKAIPVSTPPAFKAIKLATKPQDGNDPVFHGYTYSLAFNQLNQQDMTIAPGDDLSGNWTVGYHENWLYGVVNRVDDITVTSMKQTYENDNVEIFLQSGDAPMTQFRTVIGQDFESNHYAKHYHAQWNESGTQLFFAIELESAIKSGDSFMWNIALSDNDDGEKRKYQLYPVAGSNIAYLGEELTKLIVE